MKLFKRTDGRYYAIGQPAPDLFGDQVVVAYHGSIHSRIGGVRTWPASQLPHLVKTRLAHGYHEIPILP